MVIFNVVDYLFLCLIFAQIIEIYSIWQRFPTKTTKYAIYWCFWNPTPLFQNFSYNIGVIPGFNNILYILIYLNYSKLLFEKRLSHYLGQFLIIRKRFLKFCWFTHFFIFLWNLIVIFIKKCFFLKCL